VIANNLRVFSQKKHLSLLFSSIDQARPGPHTFGLWPAKFAHRIAEHDVANRHKTENAEFLAQCRR